MKDDLDAYEHFLPDEDEPVLEEIGETAVTHINVKDSINNETEQQECCALKNCQSNEIVKKSNTPDNGESIKVQVEKSCTRSPMEITKQNEDGNVLEEQLEASQQNQLCSASDSAFKKNLPSPSESISVGNLEMSLQRLSDEDFKKVDGQAVLRDILGPEAM